MGKRNAAAAIVDADRLQQFETPPKRMKHAPAAATNNTTQSLTTTPTDDSAHEFTLSKEFVDGTKLMDLNLKQWRIGKPIGKGSFGEIFLASDDIDTPVTTENAMYVVKIEPHSNGPLFVEIHCLLNTAKRSDTCHIPPGMPEYIASGSHIFKNDRYRFLILKRYERDLHSLIKNKRVNPKSIPVVACQILDVLEHLHDQSYVHSDIKAENLMIGKVAAAGSPLPDQNGVTRKGSTPVKGRNGGVENNESGGKAGRRGGGKKGAGGSRQAGGNACKSESVARHQHEFGGGRHLVENGLYQHQEQEMGGRVRNLRPLKTVTYRDLSDEDDRSRTGSGTGGASGGGSGSMASKGTPTHRRRGRKKTDDASFSCSISPRRTGYEELRAATEVAHWNELHHRQHHGDADGAAADVDRKPAVPLEDRIHLIDFGLASKFMDSTGQHRPFCMDQRRAHDGTLEFTSRDAHMGAHARRSDLECLGYNLVYWSRGFLPWKDEKLLNQPEQVHRMKEYFMADVREMLRLIYGDDCPAYLGEFLAYVGGLTYDERPDYHYCRSLFVKELKRLGCLVGGRSNAAPRLQLDVDALERLSEPLTAQDEAEITNKINHVKSLMKLGALFPYRESTLHSKATSPKNLRSKRREANGRNSLATDAVLHGVAAAGLAMSEGSGALALASSVCTRKKEKKISCVEIFATDADQIARERVEKEYERAEQMEETVIRYTGRPTYAIQELERKMRSGGAGGAGGHNGCGGGSGGLEYTESEDYIKGYTKPMMDILRKRQSQIFRDIEAANAATRVKEEDSKNVPQEEEDDESGEEESAVQGDEEEEDEDVDEEEEKDVRGTDPQEMSIDEEEDEEEEEQAVEMQDEDVEEENVVSKNRTKRDNYYHDTDYEVQLDEEDDDDDEEEEEEVSLAEEEEQEHQSKQSKVAIHNGHAPKKESKGRQKAKKGRIQQQSEEDTDSDFFNDGGCEEEELDEEEEEGNVNGESDGEEDDDDAVAAATSGRTTAIEDDFDEQQENGAGEDDDQQDSDFNDQESTTSGSDVVIPAKRRRKVSVSRRRNGDGKTKKTSTKNSTAKAKGRGRKKSNASKAACVEEFIHDNGNDDVEPIVANGGVFSVERFGRKAIARGDQLSRKKQPVAVPHQHHHHQHHHDEVEEEDDGDNARHNGHVASSAAHSVTVRQRHHHNNNNHCNSKAYFGDVDDSSHDTAPPPPTNGAGGFLMAASSESKYRLVKRRKSGLRERIRPTDRGDDYNQERKQKAAKRDKRRSEMAAHLADAVAGGMLPRGSSGVRGLRAPLNDEDASCSSTMSSASSTASSTGGSGSVSSGSSTSHHSIASSSGGRRGSMQSFVASETASSIASFGNSSSAAAAPAKATAKQKRKLGRSKKNVPAFAPAQPSNKRRRGESSSSRDHLDSGRAEEQSEAEAPEPASGDSEAHQTRWSRSNSNCSRSAATSRSSSVSASTTTAAGGGEAGAPSLAHDYESSERLAALRESDYFIEEEDDDDTRDVDYSPVCTRRKRKALTTAATNTTGNTSAAGHGNGISAGRRTATTCATGTGRKRNDSTKGGNGGRGTTGGSAATSSSVSTDRATITNNGTSANHHHLHAGAASVPAARRPEPAQRSPPPPPPPVVVAIHQPNRGRRYPAQHQNYYHPMEEPLPPLHHRHQHLQHHHPPTMLVRTYSRG